MSLYTVGSMYSLYKTRQSNMSNVTVVSRYFNNKVLKTAFEI